MRSGRRSPAKLLECPDSVRHPVLLPAGPLQTVTVIDFAHYDSYTCHEQGLSTLSLMGVQSCQAHSGGLQGPRSALQALRAGLRLGRRRRSPDHRIVPRPLPERSSGARDYGDRSTSNPTIATLLELARVYRIDPKSGSTWSWRTAASDLRS